MTGPRPEELAARALGGDLFAAARLMRALDDRMAGSVEALRLLYPHTGRAYVIGLTGNPGAGKSTLVDGIIARYRAAGRRVGVVAVDPTSPFSGGAVLGDRIRMTRHALDPDVFVRSLATRGHLGGLSRSTADVVCVLDACGFDPILVETVGVGQDEVEIVSMAHTAVVITVPGLGDEVQAIKAGILEIADVLVVNKADREGYDRAVRDLTTMLELRAVGAPPVEIVRTVASRGEGLDELLAAIARHRAGQAGGAAAARERRRAGHQLLDLVHAELERAAADELERRGGLDALADAVARRERDPYAVAREVAAAMLVAPRAR